MQKLLLALAALVLLAGPAPARPRCGPGETALKNGVCATMRPYSPVAPLSGPRPSSPTCADGSRPDASGRCRTASLCPGGRAPDTNGLCGQGSLCANGAIAIGGACPSERPCTGGACARPALTPGPPVVPLPQSGPPRLGADPGLLLR